MTSLRLQHIQIPLDHFTLEVNATLHGRVTAVFGPSGSGKTTLLEIVAGLRRPSRGRIELGGRLFNDTAMGVFLPPERRRIGYVPQEGALFPHLSVRANLLYGRRSSVEKTIAGPQFSLQTVAAVLEIGPLLERPSVQGLSGGERQRVALGRALLASPEMLLLDEPLAGLDAALKSRVLLYLIRVRDEFAVPMLYVTHSPGEVMALCDEVLILERGRVVAQGTPGEQFEASAAPTYVPRTPSRLV